MIIKSITSVNGWYRVIGASVKSYSLEEIAVFAVVQYGKGELADDIIVGIPADHLGVSGNEEEHYRFNIAGYVRESQTEIGPSGERVLKQSEWQQLAWED